MIHDRPTRPIIVSPSIFETMLHTNTELLTALVDIVFALLHLRLKRLAENAQSLWDCSAALGRDGKLCQGISNFSIAFPMIPSFTPLEQTLAVTQADRPVVN